MRGRSSLPLVRRRPERNRHAKRSAADFVREWTKADSNPGSTPPFFPQPGDRGLAGGCHSQNESPDYEWKPQECVRRAPNPCDRWRDSWFRLTRQRTSAWAPTDPFLFVRPATSPLSKSLFAGLLFSDLGPRLGHEQSKLRLSRQHKLPICRHF